MVKREGLAEALVSCFEEDFAHFGSASFTHGICHIKGCLTIMTANEHTTYYRGK